MTSDQPAEVPGAQPAVVLVDGAAGGELAAVAEALTGPLATPTVLLRGADLAAAPIVLGPSGRLAVGDRVVRPVVVWLRHVSAGALLAQSSPAGSASPLAAQSWADLLGQLAGSAGIALPGTVPAGTGQLRAAERLGVRTPRTVLTTDLAAGVRALGAARVIVKSPDFRLYQPDRAQWPACLPVIHDAAELDGATAQLDGTTAVLDGPVARSELLDRPVVVQEYLPHARELRVYYLDGSCCAFEVRHRGPASIWTDPASVRVTAVDCPARVVEAVRLLATGWQLRYGAFDLLVRDDEEPVFLEVNLDGDWLWYEHKADWHGVSFMAAVMVRELFLRATGDGRAAVPPAGAEGSAPPVD